MKYIISQQNTCVLPLFALTCTFFLTAGDSHVTEKQQPTGYSWLQAGKAVWQSAFCRGARKAVKENPRTAVATSIGTGMMLTGAPLIGGLIATSAVAMNNDINVRETSRATFDRVVESADHGYTKFNTELRQTLRDGAQDLEQVSVALAEHIGLAADRAIHSIGQAGNNLTDQLGESTSRIVDTAGLAIQGNILQLSAAGQQIVNSLNNAAQNIGTEGRRSTQFFMKTLLQTCGFGSLGFAGALVFYKHLMHPESEKSKIYAATGAGITLASLLGAKFMFDKDLAAETEHARQRAAQYQTASQASAQDIAALRATVQAGEESRNREAQARLRESFAKSVAEETPKTDPEIDRSCKYARDTAAEAEKLAKSFAVKSSVKPTDLEKTKSIIAQTLSAAKQKLELAEAQYKEREERSFNLLNTRITQVRAPLPQDDAQAVVLDRTLEQERVKKEQREEHNALTIQQRRAEIELTEQLIAQQLGLNHATLHSPTISSSEASSSAASSSPVL